MCGISGLITTDNKFNFSYSNDAAQLKNLMKTRGPDNQGSIKIRNKDAVLYFFSSRLKIIDLGNNSNQPFVFYLEPYHPQCQLFYKQHPEFSCKIFPYSIHL